MVYWISCGRRRDSYGGPETVARPDPAHAREGPPLTQVAICIPVRNEADDLPRLFDALEWLDRGPLDRVHVCLLLDGCTDGSAALVGGYAARSRHAVASGEALPSAANAGRARGRAMALGVAALGVAALGGGDGLLLTTDADSLPAPNWLTTMTAALRAADVVAGRIVRVGERPCPLQDRVEAYYDALFALRRRLDPVPWEAAVTHHQAGGANLGIRAAAYAAVGGFRALASGEDARLVDDAARAGLTVRRDAACVVRTSDRRVGRAVGGLSLALRHLDEADAARIDVAHPADQAWQYRHHAAARAAHADGRWQAIAASLGLDHDHVRGVARDCANAEAFAMRIVPTPPGGMRATALPAAEAALATLLREREAA